MQEGYFTRRVVRRSIVAYLSGPAREIGARKGAGEKLFSPALLSPGAHTQKRREAGQHAGRRDDLVQAQERQPQADCHRDESTRSRLPQDVGRVPATPGVVLLLALRAPRPVLAVGHLGSAARALHPTRIAPTRGFARRHTSRRAATTGDSAGTGFRSTLHRNPDTRRACRTCSTCGRTDSPNGRAFPAPICTSG